MNPGNSITVRDVVVDHTTGAGSVRALEVDWFHVDAAESVAVMGSSGSGKSTLLGLLAGLATPTRGEVAVGSTVLSALGERDRTSFRSRQLGMVYQADNLLPHLTVEENVALAVAIAGPADSQREPPGRLLDRLGLSELSHRFPDQLSGGQRQRAAVARALVARPSVLLADEPTGALDVKNADAVIELLVESRRIFGATLVVVTHDPAIAKHLDRVFHLAGPGRQAA